MILKSQKPSKHKTLITVSTLKKNGCLTFFLQTECITKSENKRQIFQMDVLGSTKTFLFCSHFTPCAVHMGNMHVGRQTFQRPAFQHWPLSRSTHRALCESPCPRQTWPLEVRSHVSCSSPLHGLSELHKVGEFSTSGNLSRLSLEKE